MRFNARNLILGLAALGSIPEGLGRVVPRSTSNSLACPLEVSTYDAGLEARVAPVRVGVGGKPSGGKPGGKPGGSTGKPEGSTPGGDGENTPPHILVRAMRPAEPQAVPAGGNGNTKQEQTPAFLEDRGGKLIEKAAHPQKGADMSDRMSKNYKFDIEEAEGVEDSIPLLKLDQYGFDKSTKGWNTVEIRCSSCSESDPVAKISYSRVTKGDKNYVSFVAHERKATNDGNRYKLDKNGANEEDASHNPIPNPDAKTKAVSVAELVFEGANKLKKQQPDLLKPDADKVFLVSENVINTAAQKMIPEALKKFPKGVFRNGAAGEEGKQFKILAGLDNNFSYLSMASKNPDFFKHYKLSSITVIDGGNPAMNMEFDKI
ncbi:hypothetical protein PG999_002366 [Apiospora kogelbergensis]|uniref:Uncharacterized protein n=1 Tax=Apiospora kogelbergensis TaxID=1337665 RepID=A0AAW0R867_9PEZI